MTPPHSQHTPAILPTPATTPTPPTPRAYRVPPVKAWEVFAMLQASFGAFTDPRQLLAAMNDDLPQLLCVCMSNEMDRRPVERIYATFGNPEKTHFVVGGYGLLAPDPKQRGGESFVSVVESIARRLGLEALEGAEVGELEGMGWVESSGLVAGRVEAGLEAFDVVDEVKKRFTSMVLPRLLGTTGRSTPPERTGQEICGASGADRMSHL
ncbi:hypothetical protein LTR12_005194 [Friedmanniomyces endolithicus]|nr:hypothetical protein LTR74_003063 [Friedmanniomyces endolithicus]KAK1820331.1 hypothetical protein LTR12_005194 [Friedmanniomyces endolithicus]